MKKKLYTKNNGFTLVEMIVSIAIFVVVALVAVGAMLKVVDANRKSQSLKTAVNNMDFALESMSREMRTGNNYDCETGTFSYTAGSALPHNACASNSTWTIAFYSSKTAVKSGGGTCNLVHAYRFANSTIEKAEQPTCSSSLNSSSFSAIISPDVNLTTAIANLTTASSPSYKPIIFFYFSGYSGIKDADKTYFDIQTSISQRVSD